MTERATSLGEFVSAASLWIPSFVNGSAWVGHAPFLFWLLEQSKPHRFVELGTHEGYSYFAACEAVTRLRLRTQCFAVDHWRGDEHAGVYDGNVFRDVKSRNEAYYGEISRLIRESFRDALPYVEDGSVDLLHIDGRHFYEDVKEDFESWRPKLSDRAIVLFHDTTVRERGFGVYRYWAELAASHPTFEFHHGHGLGVLCAGRLPDGPLGKLLRLGPESAMADDVRACYRRLGASISDRGLAEQVRRIEKELGAAKVTAARVARLEERVKAEAARSLARIKTLRQDTKAATRTLDKLWSSEKAWRAASAWDRLRGRIPPLKAGRSKGRKPAAQGEAGPAPAPVVPSLNPTEARMAAALALGRSEGWLAAEPAWRALWEEQPLAETVDSEKILSPLPAVDGVYEDVAPGQGRRDVPTKWCIYTTLFGRYDTLQPPLAPPAGLTLICLTDHDVEVDGWTSIRVPSEGDPLRAAKAYKMLPFDHLPGFDASLFIDANMLVHGDVRRFVERWCIDEPFVMWRHSHRADVYDEAEAILVKQKSDPGLVLDQIARYEREGLPRCSGVNEGNFIWRRHDSEPVRHFMAEWHAETSRESPRDQLSLGYLMWKSGMRPRTFPTSLGTARRNAVTSVTPHRPEVPGAGAGQEGGMGAIRRRAARGAKRRIAFLWEPDYASSGSTIMRGLQLSKLVAHRLGDTFDVSYLPRSEAPSDSIVILTKGCLARAKPEDLRELGARNLAIVADFVDGEIRSDLYGEIDLVWASSIKAFRAHVYADTGVPTDMVTHHADPRIRLHQRPDRFSVGYFGELVNTVKTDSIERTVRFHAVDTKTASSDWLDFVGMFAMHYAIRARGKGATFHKPFLKGFTAARCDANIIVDRNDGDARYYLGDDYPYLAASSDEAEVLRMLEVARESYGTDTWRYGLEIMDYVRSVSSDDHVCREVLRSLRRF